MPPGDAKQAYLDGLKMLARHELSEARVRDRLARRGYEQDAIDTAVARLRAEHAIDDARVAEAIARTETSRRRRPRASASLSLSARAGVRCRPHRKSADCAQTPQLIAPQQPVEEPDVQRRTRGTRRAFSAKSSAGSARSALIVVFQLRARIDTSIARAARMSIGRGAAGCAPSAATIVTTPAPTAQSNLAGLTPSRFALRRAAPTRLRSSSSVEVTPKRSARRRK